MQVIIYDRFTINEWKWSLITRFTSLNPRGSFMG